MDFDYWHSESREIAQRRKYFFSPVFIAVKYLGIFFICLSLLVIILDTIRSLEVSKFLLSMAYFACSILGGYFLLQAFYHFKLRHRSRSIKLADALRIQEGNLAEYLAPESAVVLEKCLELALEYHLAVISSGTLLVSLYSSFPGKWIMVRLGLVIKDDLKKQLLGRVNRFSKAGTSFGRDLVFVLEDAARNAVLDGREEIEIEDLVLSLAQNDPLTKKMVFQLNLREEDVEDVVDWYHRMLNLSKTTPFWQRKYHGEGIGRNWAAGYTPVLNLFSSDISTYLAEKPGQYHTLAHKNNIGEIERILTKSNKNNVLLVGDPGVGKRNIVEGFAQKVAKGQVAEPLRYKHVLQLQTGKLLAGAPEETEAKLLRVLDEAVLAGNIILFIGNFPDLISGDIKEIGTIDASKVFIPYLSSGGLQVIATSTFDDYHYKIELNSYMKNLFSKIEVQEPNLNEVVNILKEILWQIEFHGKVIFTYQAMKKIVELANRYIHDKPFPEKAVDLAREVAVYVASSQNKLIPAEIIEKIVAEKTKIPVSSAKEEEREVLLHLEEFLHQRVIGQEEAIAAVANAMRRARAGLAGKGRPMGSFLFIGPTGVGKTETAKALAAAYFGSENNMIRFDMSEFQEPKSIDLLIGASAVAEEMASQGRLTQIVHENPYSLVLLDEIEKAHPNILNLFLQVLDEGKLSDAAGRTVDFSNTIIIATSNAGAEKIREYLQEKATAEDLKETILDYLQKQGIFKPEFLNRFDAIVCYKPLTPAQIVQVALLMIKKLNSQLQEKEIGLEISPEAVEILAQGGYDPVLGARELRRVIQEKLENLLAKKILSGQLQRGQTIKITPEDLR